MNAFVPSGKNGIRTRSKKSHTRPEMNEADYGGQEPLGRTHHKITKSRLTSAQHPEVQ